MVELQDLEVFGQVRSDLLVGSTATLPVIDCANLFSEVRLFHFTIAYVQEEALVDPRVIYVTRKDHNAVVVGERHGQEALDA